MLPLLVTKGLNIVTPVVAVWLCCSCGAIQVVDFYEFYEGLQEGWDGPALLVFSDGKKIGARLDRNGLRPARFWRTSDDTIYVASEVGVLGDVMSNAGRQHLQHPASAASVLKLQLLCC
jgi:hypothetical protein